MQYLSKSKGIGLLLIIFMSFSQFSFCFADKVKPSVKIENSIASQKRLVAIALCYVIGNLGAHRFYVGKNVSAIFQLLTLGGLGVWTFVDLIYILLGEFKNTQGQKLVDWT